MPTVIEKPLMVKSLTAEKEETGQKGLTEDPDLSPPKHTTTTTRRKTELLGLVWDLLLLQLLIQLIS